MKSKSILLMILIIGLLYSCKKDNNGIDLKAGLLAYYPFNGNANDESGNGNNGTVYGAVLSADRSGNDTSAYYFDGVGSYIDIGSNPQIKRSGSSFSVCFWINPSSYSDGTIHAIISNRTKQPDGSHTGSLIDIPGNNYTVNGPDPLLTKKLRFVIKGGNDVEFVNSTSDVLLAQWTFITITYQFNGNDQNTVKIYINGTQEAEKVMSDIPDPGNTPTYFGFEPFNVSYLYHFHGYLDEIRIYNKVLDESEIKAIYKL